MFGRRPQWARVAVVGLPLLTLAVVAAAAVNADLVWSFFGAGGGRIESRSYIAQTGTGLPVVGAASSSTHRLCSGAWCTTQGPAPARFRAYLPVVLR